MNIRTVGYEERGNPRSRGPRGTCRLTTGDTVRNNEFLRRVVRIMAPESGTLPARHVRRTAVESEAIPGLTLKAEDVLTRITGKPVTPENLREWCGAHAEDGEALVLGQSRGFPGIGPTTVETCLKVLAGHGLEVSRPLGLKAPVMAALEQLIGGYPTDRSIRKWAEAHRGDWEDAVRAAFDHVPLGWRKHATVSEVLRTYGCKSDDHQLKSIPSLSTS